MIFRYFLAQCLLGQNRPRGDEQPLLSRPSWLRLFFGTILMPLDPAKDDKGTASKGPSGPGSNVRRINPGGSSHTQFGSGARGGTHCRIGFSIWNGISGVQKCEILIGGLEHGFYFSIYIYIYIYILGSSSSQLTNSYFSNGWLNHQPEYTFQLII